MRRSITAVVACVLLASCDEPTTTSAALAPIIDSAAVVPGPHNVLSAIVRLHVQRADSVAVRFHVAGASGAAITTPTTAVLGDSVSVPVLGLLADTRYALHVIARGVDGAESVDSLEFTTGPLPADLPTYTASSAGASPGYVVIAAGKYGLVLDNTGRVAWYRHFPNGLWLNFMAQPNGRYVARQVTPTSGDVESWVELDALGRVTRTFGCGLGLAARFHDLIAEPDGSYWALCDEVRTMDLTEYGGLASASVTGTAIQHVGADGTVLFHWSPFDHFLISDVDVSELRGAQVNWTHANSLDLDSDGNVIVSFRNLNEVTRIDTHTGAVLWRLGGKRNQFAFADSAQPFSGQHSIRVTGSGRVLLLDNVGDASASRAEWWQIDGGSRQARLLRSFASEPSVRTLIGGSVQSLPGEHTLVSFGTEGRVEEYDVGGSVRWRLDGSVGYVFRAQRIRSLYYPGVADPR